MGLLHNNTSTEGTNNPQKAFANFQDFADSAPEQEYPIINDFVLMDKGDITISQVQELATAEPTDDLFVLYLQNYIQRLDEVLTQIAAMKTAEKPLKQRLKYAQQLLTKITNQSTDMGIEVPTQTNVWNVFPDVIDEAHTVVAELVDFPDEISDEFKHML